jgi:hypothetical protein
VAFKHLKTKQCDSLSAELAQCYGAGCLLDEGHELLQAAWVSAFGSGNYSGFPQDTLDIMCGQVVSSHDPSSFCSTQLARQIFCAVYTGNDPTTSAASQPTILAMLLLPLLIALRN